MDVLHVRATQAPPAVEASDTRLLAARPLAPRRLSRRRHCRAAAGGSPQRQLRGRQAGVRGQRGVGGRGLRQVGPRAVARLGLRVPPAVAVQPRLRRAAARRQVLALAPRRPCYKKQNQDQIPP